MFIESRSFAKRTLSGIHHRVAGFFAGLPLLRSGFGESMPRLGRDSVQIFPTYGWSGRSVQNGIRRGYFFFRGGEHFFIHRTRSGRY